METKIEKIEKVKKVKKRDGSIVDFNDYKIIMRIFQVLFQKKYKKTVQAYNFFR